MKRQATQVSRRAFTLIELMMVVGIIGLVAVTGFVSLHKLLLQEGLRKASSAVEELCRSARARAIFSGAPVDVVFHPLERRLEIAAAPVSAPPTPEGTPDFVAENPSPPAPPPTSPSSPGSSVQLEQEINIGALTINLLNYRESEWARVRFYPNGTSDEMKLVLVSDKEPGARGIELEVTTGLANVVTDLREIQTWNLQ